MAQKKLLSRGLLRLLLSFPEARLETLCSTFMFDILWLTEDQLCTLLEAADSDRKFRRRLGKVKREVSEENFDVFQKNLIYHMAKFFGYLDFKAKNKEQRRACIEAVDFFVNQILTPAIRMLKHYQQSGLVEKRHLALLKQEMQED